MLYLLLNTNRPVTVEFVTSDPVKAKHWEELLEEQGKDVLVAELENKLFHEMIEDFGKG